MWLIALENAWLYLRTFFVKMIRRLVYNSVTLRSRSVEFTVGLISEHFNYMYMYDVCGYPCDVCDGCDQILPLSGVWSV